jgi:hypothetical protein
MKNKKADANVTLMVFMTAVIFTSMLFIFITSQKNLVKSMINPESINEVYLEENLVRFYVFGLAEEALYFSLKEVDKDDLLFDVKIQENFKKNFEEQLNKNINIPSINQLKEKYDKKEIEITYENKKFEVLVKGFSINKQEFSKTRQMIKLWKFIPLFIYEEKIQQSLGIIYDSDIKISITL